MICRSNLNVLTHFYNRLPHFYNITLYDYPNFSVKYDANEKNESFSSCINCYRLQPTCEWEFKESSDRWSISRIVEHIGICEMLLESIEYLTKTKDDLRSYNLRPGSPSIHQRYITLFGHCDRHLRQIRKIKQHPNYPKS